MIVVLTYFKNTGKMYTEGRYSTDKDDLNQIWDEVRSMIRAKTLPGLEKGSWDFMILVQVPDHPHNHPRIVNIKYRDPACVRGHVPDCDCVDDVTLQRNFLLQMQAAEKMQPFIGERANKLEKEWAERKEIKK